MSVMSSLGTENWSSSDAGFKQHDHAPGHGSRQAQVSQSLRIPGFQAMDKPRSFGESAQTGFWSPHATSAAGGGSRRHLAPVEVRAQAASELLASEDAVGTPSSGSGGSSSSPPRTLPHRRHTMPANMLPPLVVPAFRPSLVWTDVSSRSTSEASPGLTSPGSKANGQLTSPPSSERMLLPKPPPGRVPNHYEDDCAPHSRHKSGESTPGSPVTVGKGPTGMQPSPMSPTGSSPSALRLMSPAENHSQPILYRSHMHSPDYVKATGDLHYPSPSLLNRSLPTPGSLMRAQSMPLQPESNELDTQGRVQEICEAARAGDHSMVRALLQGAKSQEQIIDAVNEVTGRTALHEAVMGEHYDMVLHLLMEGGADPDTKLSSQGPPLLRAVETNNDKMVDILLSAGASADASDLGDNTALHKAASLGHRRILKNLLARGANPMLRNCEGQMPIECSVNEKTQHVFERYVRRNPSVDLGELPGKRGGGMWDIYSEPEGKMRSKSVSEMPTGRHQWQLAPPKQHESSSRSNPVTSPPYLHEGTYSSSAPLVGNRNDGYHYADEYEERREEEDVFDSFDSADTVQEKPEENFLEEAYNRLIEGKVPGINPSDAERVVKDMRPRAQSDPDGKKHAPKQGGGSAGQSRGGDWNPRSRSLTEKKERYSEQQELRPFQHNRLQNASLMRTLSGGYPASTLHSSSDSGHEFGSQNRGPLFRHQSDVSGRFDMSGLSRTLGAPPSYHNHMGYDHGRALARTSYGNKDPRGSHLNHESWDFRGVEFAEARPPAKRQSSHPVNFYLEQARHTSRPLERQGSLESAKTWAQSLERTKNELSHPRFSGPGSAFTPVVGDRGNWSAGRSHRRSEGAQLEWGNGADEGGGNVQRSARSNWGGEDWASKNRRETPPSETGRLLDSPWGGEDRIMRLRSTPPELKSPFSPTPPGSTPVSPRGTRLRQTEGPKAPQAAPKLPPSAPSPTPANKASSSPPLPPASPPLAKPSDVSKAPSPPPADVNKVETPPPPVKLPPPALKRATSSGSDTSGATPPKGRVTFFNVADDNDEAKKDIKLLRKDWQEAASKNGCVSCGKVECNGSCNPSTKPKAPIPPSAKDLFGEAETKLTGSFVWTRGELLGEGAYGKVFAGLNQETGQLMAVKQLKLNDSDQSREYQRHVAALEREISLYRKMRHRHIVGYINMERDDASGSLYVFLEYVSGGSIHSMLERFGKFSEPLVRVYTRQLLQGLEYLHECKIIHRDIKGGNVLVDRDGIVKLADFGASKAFHDATLTDGCKSIRGSVFWMAPEVIKGDGYGRRADIWSVGCTVIEMLTGSHPWPGIDNTWTAIFHIAKALTGPPMPEIASPLAKDFLNLCFALDPKERPTATELLQHPFVCHAGEVAQAPVP